MGGRLKRDDIVYRYIADSHCDTVKLNKLFEVIMLQIKTFFKMLELKIFMRKEEV